MGWCKEKARLLPLETGIDKRRRATARSVFAFSVAQADIDYISDMPKQSGRLHRLRVAR